MKLLCCAALAFASSGLSVAPAIGQNVPRVVVDDPPESDPSVRASAALFIMHTRSAPDQVWSANGLGVLITEDRAIVHLSVLVGASEAKLVSVCCGERAITGVLSRDPVSNTALVRLAPPADAQTQRPQPVAFNPECVPPGEKVWLSEGAIQGTGLMLVTAPSLGPKTWGSTPPSTLIDMPTARLQGAGAAFDNQTRFLGFVGYFGGAHRSMVTPPKLDLAAAGSVAAPLTELASVKFSAHDQAVMADGKQDGLVVLELYRKAIAEDPRDWYAHWRLGVLLDESGKGAEALNVLKTGAALAPEFSEVSYSVGIVLLGLDKPEDAIAPLRRATELEPRYAAAHGMLAAALYKTGAADQALPPARKAVELDRKDFTNARNLCTMLRDAGKADEQQAVWRSFIKESPKDPQGWQELSKVVWELPGEEPIDVQREWMKADPDNATPVSWLASKLHERGRDAEAVPPVDEFLKRHPDNQRIRGIHRLLTEGEAKPAK